MIEIDHILYAVADLDAAADRLEAEFGLGSYAGGTHPAFGTANRIVPLGDAYLELIGVIDRAVAASNPVGSFITSWTANGDRLLSWVVRTDDIDGLASRLGLSLVPGERARPDGSVISWRAAGMERLLTDPALPFLIAWDDPEGHPGRQGSPQGLLGSIEVGIAEGELATGLGGTIERVRCVDGPRGVRRVTVEAGDGSVIAIT